MKTGKLILAAVGCVALVLPAGPGYARDLTRDDVARAMKLPDTAAEHTAMAKSYEDKAAEWRAEAERHVHMAAAYEASHPNSKDAETMQKHCSKIAKDAQEMATEAQLMADYHRLRAKESK